jgi:hypothetical protein
MLRQRLKSGGTRRFPMAGRAGIGHGAVQARHGNRRGGIAVEDGQPTLVAFLADLAHLARAGLGGACLLGGADRDQQ